MGEKDENLNSDQVEGRVDKAAGSVKETVGEATGDSSLAREGRADQAAGEAQETVGNLKESITEATDTAATDISEAVRERNAKS